jgi:hypothetical protein
MLAMSVAAAAQTAPALPDLTVGVGPSWMRGAAYPLSIDTDVAIHLAGNWYSWTTVRTPAAPTPTNGMPVASTITTGGAYVAARSSTGAVSLVLIVETGFSTSQATSNVTPAFNGDIGVAFRLGKSNTYLMPYAKAANAALTSTGGGLATAVFQPGIMLLYGFRKEK